MKKFSRSHHDSMNELNITPLLDLAFVLLVIFIITTPQMMNNLELNLPTAQKPPPTTPKPSKPKRIDLKASGTVELDFEARSLEQLRTSLQTMKQQDPDMSIVVHAEGDSVYQQLVSVLDLIQQLQITKVGMATEVSD